MNQRERLKETLTDLFWAGHLFASIGRVGMPKEEVAAAFRKLAPRLKPDAPKRAARKARKR